MILQDISKFWPDRFSYYILHYSASHDFQT